MKILFYNHELCYRGTTKAILDYLDALRRLCPEIDVTYVFNRFSTHNTVNTGLLFLKQNVGLVAVDTLQDVLEMSKSADWLYYVTSGLPGDYEWLNQSSCRTLLHQVGYQDPDYNSATYFAYTSYWQSHFFTGGQAPVLPYIINPPKISISKLEARSRLGLPDHHIVFGRHGGRDTWNLPFASKAVYQTALKNKDKYFLFLATEPFCDLPNVKFLPATCSPTELEIFLSSCDIMLHARWEGETFGLACAEFLARKKPIITWAHSRERNHILLAEQSAMFYHGYNDLMLLLQSITIETIESLHQFVPTNRLLQNYSPESIGTKLKLMLYS